MSSGSERFLRGPQLQDLESRFGNRTFLTLPGVPVHVGVLWTSAEAARSCGRGDIRLAFDDASGFIWNAAFDASRVDYSLRYDNALHFSPRFRLYEESLARRLIGRHDIRQRDVVEIGAGGGHFLGLLCDLGENRGTGFDPSYDPSSAGGCTNDRVRIVRDYFDERHATWGADFLVCRHVLEHVSNPRAMLRGIRSALESRPDAVLYFEVPNSYFILRDLSIWDVIYEHCGYFVPESLGQMFEECGFELLDLYETYDGQFVGVEARCALSGHPPPRRDMTDLTELVRRFPARFAARRSEWADRLDEMRAKGHRAVIWGAGAKAVSFLNLLELSDQIEYAVDVNPGKVGTYLAGSGQEIVAPEFLASYRPDIAIVMNPIYEAEIAAQLASLSPTTRTICV